MFIFSKGADVPEWLEKVEPTTEGDINYVRPTIKFVQTTLVYKKSGTFYVRPVFSLKGAVLVVSDGNNVTITGQGKGVVISTKPLLPTFPLVMSLLFIASLVFNFISK